METQKFSGTISSTTGKQYSMPIPIRILALQERRKLALKSLGIFWALMIATAPLPPIHWITVPFFFIFGLYSFFKKWGEERYIQALEFPCPECEKLVPSPEQGLKNPLLLCCPHCRYNLKLTWLE